MKIEPSDDLNQESNHAHRQAMNSQPNWLHLTENEEVLWRGRQSRIPLLPTYFIFGIVLIAIVAIFVAGGPMSFLPFPDMALTDLHILGGVTVTISLLATLGLVILALGSLLGIVVTYLRWRFTQYALTTQELYIRFGIISESVTQVRLENIQDTRCSRSILERLLGYGDVSIDTAGRNTIEVFIENIPNPQEVNGILTKQRGRIATNRRNRNNISGT